MEQAVSESPVLVLDSILLFCGIAGLVVPLLQLLRIPAVLGYLICGVIIGPFGLSVFVPDHPWLAQVTVADTYAVRMLGEFGIIALMFMIGLEFSFERLRELRRYILGLGTAQVVVTATIITAIASAFGNSTPTSLLLGLSLSLSSTAIVMKVLQDQKLASRPIGILCFSILLMQDLAVVPVLVLLSSFTADAGRGVVYALLVAVLVGGFTVVAIYWLGRKVLAPLLRLVSLSSSAEWLTAFVLFIVVMSSLLTYISGLSLALGAFIAGLLVAETEFRHEVEIIINPLKGLLLGIFFLSVGMMINMAEVLLYPGLLLLAVVGLYLLKSSLILLLCLAFRTSGRLAAEAAVYLAQPGEFALMILGAALATGLLEPEAAQFFLLTTALAMLVSPLVFKLAPTAGRYGQRLLDHRALPDPSTFMPDRPGVVIAGMGRVGQLIARMLERQRIPYVAFDNDGELIQQLKRRGIRILYGDARNGAIWRRMIGEHIVAAVIAIDDQQATRSILRSLRAQFPLMPVIVRSRAVEDVNGLYASGANHVVAEPLESSLRIVQLLMKELKGTPEEIQQILEKSRVIRKEP